MLAAKGDAATEIDAKIRDLEDRLRRFALRRNKSVSMA
jgi:hypothetical protein